MSAQEPNELTPAPLQHASTRVVARVRQVPPSTSSPAPDALGLIKALRRRSGLAIGLGLILAAVIGPAAWFLMPPAKYTASATLYVATERKRIMWAPQDHQGKPETFQKTQVALLTDRYVLSDALTKPEVAGLPTIKELMRNRLDPEDWLKENLSAKFANESEVLEVSLSGDRPEDLKTVVNAVVDSYMTKIVDEERKERIVRLDQLKKLWEKYQRDLKIKRKSLETLAKSVGSDDQRTLAISQQFKVAQITLAQSELARANSELLKAEAELAALANENPVTPVINSATSHVEDRVDLHPEVAALRAERDRWDQKYRGVARLARSRVDPALLNAKAGLLAAEKAWQEAKGRVRAELLEGRDAVTTTGASDDRGRMLARARAHAGVMKGYKEALTRDIDRLQKEVKSLGQGGLDIESEREEISIATDFARKVGAEVEYVQVELDAPDRVRVMAKARTPRPKDELRKAKAGLGSALGAFAVSLLGVSFWEFRSRRVDAPDEVVNGLGLRLVGTLPALPSRARRSGGEIRLVDRRWQRMLVESVDSMRTMLLHASRVDSTRVVMVTSAVKGEGKTSLSCHLATSLARAGRRTLLIDGDLRRPAIYRLLDLSSGPGMCEFLRKEAQLEELIQETSDGYLDFIAAGACSGPALQALAAQGELKALFDSLRHRYEFIIVDSAPVLPVADSLLIGQSVDTVLFSVLRGVSRLPDVHAARERFETLGIKTLGGVLSGVQSALYQPEYYSVTEPNS